VIGICFYRMMNLDFLHVIILSASYDLQISILFTIDLLVNRYYLMGSIL